MILPNSKDAIHKAWLYRLLSAIYDNQILANSLYFKGGTCAAMQEFLDRFSIDLDFDYVAEKKDLAIIKNNLEIIFANLGLIIKDSSKNTPQYFLKYPTNKENKRNTIKIDVTMPSPKSNQYEPARLKEIDRIVFCQTIETMFANKLVALIDRWEKNNSIAGRDLYDIHHFFINGYQYNKNVIIERRKNSDLKFFFQKLVDFIQKEITETIINQDINMLLQPQKFQSIRKTLKQETLMFLNDEIKRL
ncbi:nucleotidyl transferase AbiEii/AbiGii toxin family protein [Candidatus Kuenenbacteria bacterium]|nr:nucleotidyl transferase AbiEii/AbiGii toxin family protein [Candidatus Kuenenbacteria bacterium]